MSTSSAGPVILIAGGSGSIGTEIAAQAAEGGWAVAIHGRRQASADAAAALVRDRAPGSAITAHAADFAQPRSVEALVGDTVREHGRVDAVIDCSTGGPSGIAGPFEGTEPAAYAAFAEQSVVVFQRLAHAALPHLKQRGGTLLAFVSDAAIFAAPRQAIIGAMRAATVGFVRNLAIEVARDKVRVHAISPSYVDETRVSRQLAAQSAERMETARRHAGLGLPTPADIAPLALFLCSPQASKLTGQVISVNGGVNA